ncbi:hypothetical protein FGO68_gene16920 [Halteria grandinella]|uniref:Uncharacterized protein n=1 Tax=Halteria grandinella TaxID=5974 RepID=A0A8J8P3D3_HALGN|nr:hypothetical protein FGO68_gene16920 [Halteria grandinella]
MQTQGQQKMWPLSHQQLKNLFHLEQTWRQTRVIRHSLIQVTRIEKYSTDFSNFLWAIQLGSVRDVNNLRLREYDNTLFCLIKHSYSTQTLQNSMELIKVNTLTGSANQIISEPINYLDTYDKYVGLAVKNEHLGGCISTSWSGSSNYKIGFWYYNDLTGAFVTRIINGISVLRDALEFYIISWDNMGIVFLESGLIRVIRIGDPQAGGDPTSFNYYYYNTLLSSNTYAQTLHTRDQIAFVIGHIYSGTDYYSTIQTTNNAYRCSGISYSYYTWEYSYWVSFNRYSNSLLPTSTNTATSYQLSIVSSDMQHNAQQANPACGGLPPYVLLVPPSSFPSNTACTVKQWCYVIIGAYTLNPACSDTQTIKFTLTDTTTNTVLMDKVSFPLNVFNYTFKPDYVDLGIDSYVLTAYLYLSNGQLYTQDSSLQFTTTTNDPCQFGTTFSQTLFDSVDYLTYTLSDTPYNLTFSPLSWSPYSCATGITYTLVDDALYDFISVDSSTHSLSISTSNFSLASQYLSILMKATLTNYYQHTTVYEVIKVLIISKREFRKVANHAPYMIGFDGSEEVEIECGERKVVQIGDIVDEEDDSVSVRVQFGRLSAFAWFDRYSISLIIQPKCEYDIYEVIKIFLTDGNPEFPKTSIAYNYPIRVYYRPQESPIPFICPQLHALEITRNGYLTLVSQDGSFYEDIDLIDKYIQEQVAISVNDDSKVEALQVIQLNKTQIQLKLKLDNPSRISQTSFLLDWDLLIIKMKQPGQIVKGLFNCTSITLNITIPPQNYDTGNQAYYFVIQWLFPKILLILLILTLLSSILLPKCLSSPFSLISLLSSLQYLTHLSLLNILLPIDAKDFITHTFYPVININFFNTSDGYSLFSIAQRYSKTQKGTSDQGKFEGFISKNEAFLEVGYSAGETERNLGQIRLYSDIVIVAFVGSKILAVIAKMLKLNAVAKRFKKVCSLQALLLTIELFCMEYLICSILELKYKSADSQFNLNTLSAYQMLSMLLFYPLCFIFLLNHKKTFHYRDLRTSILSAKLYPIFDHLLKCLFIFLLTDVYFYPKPHLSDKPNIQALLSVSVAFMKLAYIYGTRPFINTQLMETINALAFYIQSVLMLRLTLEDDINRDEIGMALVWNVSIMLLINITYCTSTIIRQGKLLYLRYRIRQTVKIQKDESNVETNETQGVLLMESEVHMEGHYLHRKQRKRKMLKFKEHVEVNNGKEEKTVSLQPLKSLT